MPTWTSSTCCRYRTLPPVRRHRPCHGRVYLRIYDDQGERSSTDFLRHLYAKVLMKASKVLTDSGSQFTDRPTDMGNKPTGEHAFDCVVCLAE